MEDQRVYVRWVPAMAFVLALAVGAYVIKLRDDAWHLERAKDVEYMSASAAASVKRVLDRALGASGTLATMIRYQRGRVDDFDQYAPDILAQAPGVANIQVAPGGVVRHIYPLAGQEKAIGHDLLADPARRREALRAIETRRETFAGPFPLVQGGVGVIGRKPVFLPDASGQEVFWGFASTLIYVDDLLRETDLPVFEREGYVYQLARPDPDTGERRVFAGTREALAEAIDVEIDVPNGRWTLSVAERDARHHAPLIWVDALAALLSATLIAYVIRRMMREPQLLREQVAVATVSLHEAKERYRLLFEDSPIAVALVDPESRHLLEFNTMAHQMLGYTREEFTGLRMSDIDLGADRLPVQANDPAGAPAVYQARFCRKDGRELHVAATARAAIIEGRIVLHCVWHDITPQVDALLSLAYRQAQLKALIDSIPDFIFFKDHNGVYLGCNKAYEERAGRAESELVGRTDFDLYPPAEAEFYRAKDREMLANGRSIQVEETVRNSDGSISWFETIKTPFFGPEQDVLGLVGIARDITARKRAEQTMRLSEKVFAATAEGIMITDAAGRIVRVNPACCTITGYDEAELVGQTPSLLKSGRHDRAFYERMWQGLAEHGFWEGEIWNRRKSGEIYPEWLSIAPVRNAAGEIEQYVAVFSDFTQRKRAEEFIRHQATHDGLTGLPNRMLFLDRLKHALAHAERTGGVTALLFIDLDGFKAVNDTLGHDVGDELLRAVAGRIAQCVRAEDTVARLGGDEFTVILDSVDGPAGAATVAAKICQSIASPFAFLGPGCPVSASVGIGLSDRDGADVASLLSSADRAMYEAKRGGRNGYRFCSDGVAASAGA